MSKPSRWQASLEYLGTPGALRSTTSGVVINEVFAGLDSSSGRRPSRVAQHGGYGHRHRRLVSGQLARQSVAVSAAGQHDPRGGRIPRAGRRDFNPTPDSPGPLDFQLDEVHGDQLFLSTADGSGQVVRFEDSVRFGPGGGTSWGRDPCKLVCSPC